MNVSALKNGSLAALFGTFMFLMLSGTAFAQFAPINTNTSLSLNPVNPGPNTEVTVNLNAFSVSFTSATITWFVDNVEQVDAKNSKSLTLMTGGAGVTKNVRAVVSPTTGASFSTDIAVTPSAIDIILEADTHVPSFYKGRALPTPGAMVRAIGIYNSSSGFLPANYTYKWELAGDVLQGGGIKGKPYIDFVMPLFDDALLTLTVYSNNGTELGRKTIVLRSAEPELVFYEKNLLRGTSLVALKDTHELRGEEITIEAMPYFLTTTPKVGSEHHEWRLNGTLVDNESSNLREITLRRGNESGMATVGLKIVNTEDLLQRVERTFNILFR